MSSSIISMRNVSKRYVVPVKSGEGLWSSVKQLVSRENVIVSAVENVSLEIAKGEIRGLIGPNGAGKSTIIKMISGILYPSDGTIESMGFIPWKQRREYVRNIGVLLGQKTQLFWDLPAIDAFQLNKVIYKIPDRKFRENISYFKETLGIDGIINVPVRNLSLGERIKCEIVCSLLHEPQLVFLDEPTIGLDIFAKEGIRSFVKRVNRERNVTFILTTHDLVEVENLCHNITVINRGVVVFNDTLVSLRKYYADKKYIEVILSGRAPREKVDGFKIISSTPFSIKIEADLAVSSLQDMINRIFREYPVHDITVMNPDIEEIIRGIYCGQEMS